MHYRIRKAGYKICFNPDIISYQNIRNSWCGMLKQKYGNGHWIGLTLGVCPGCFSIHHFVPLAFSIWSRNLNWNYRNAILGKED